MERKAPGWLRSLVADPRGSSPGTTACEPPSILVNAPRGLPPQDNCQTAKVQYEVRLERRLERGRRAESFRHCIPASRLLSRSATNPQCPLEATRPRHVS